MRRWLIIYVTPVHPFLPSVACRCSARSLQCHRWHCLCDMTTRRKQVMGLADDVFDKQLKNLLAEQDKKLPRLICIEGIDELIENATAVKQPQSNVDDLWERDTDDEWTDHEYDY
ncbi:hypothetical protein BDV59DRAFT_181137 [Aspergillus ambiguus]|uniref:uncharacterized protein n=1 Tax=Aspergillus ambiguus TaxID=176160 RepID=UPI003CCDF695